VVSGGPIGNEQAVVDRALPHRSDLSTTLRKVQGRGTVAIVESPSEPNGFSLVFEVRDPGPGADDYMIEVGW
jgi:predicted enzyme related to lactoylglutathione lyase